MQLDCSAEGMRVSCDDVMGGWPGARGCSRPLDESLGQVERVRKVIWASEGGVAA